MAATAVDQKLLRQTKFPAEFNQKVDMQKVNVEVMKKWIASKISEILGSEDDIVIELCLNLLEGSRYPDIKSLQIQLTGFLDKDTAKFCKELWNLCLSAQSNSQGVPKELLEAKKLELIQEKIDAEKAAELAKRHREQEAARERDLDTLRQRERGERAERGRGRGGYRGGRGFDSRRARDSRSPPPRRRRSPYRGPPPRRDADTWVPSGRGRHRSPDRARSPTQAPSRSSSRSRSPPHPLRRRSPSMSRSRSPPPRRRRRTSSSMSRSPPPPRLRSERLRSITPVSRHRRSVSRSDSPRSRSPRRRRRSSADASSRSPPRRRRRRRSPSSSASPSRSRSRSPPHSGKNYNRAGTRRHRSPSILSKDSRSDRGADIVRNRNTRNEHRLSRSPDDAPRRRRGSIDRHTSRSPSRDRHGLRKRRRSLRRWEPAGRRQRNTSSLSGSSPEQKRRRTHRSERESASPPVETTDSRKATNGANKSTDSD